MAWAQFIHLYQLYYQQPDVLERIVGLCYRPIIEGLYEHPHARITINVNAVLLELFQKYGYEDLTGKLAEMGTRGQVEFLGSAKYHTLLPFLPPQEALRQIEINSKALRTFLGESFKPKGIFLPEMAYAPVLNQVLEDAGFEYVLLDELAYDGHVDHVDYTKRYKIEGSKLQAYFRQRRLSNAIMHRAVQTPEEVLKAGADDLGRDRYLITGMDGEVFGHWYPGFDEFLLKILTDEKLGMCQVADLAEMFPHETTIAPVACTWADSEKDLESGQPFFSWRDPDNEIQQLEWQLQQLTLTEFAKIPKDEPTWPEIREKLDPALASDLFFWSSARPWWSIELIEEGAYGLLDVVESSPASSDDAKYAARHLYHQILDLAFWWRRSGKIAAIGHERSELLRIPFKDRASESSYEGFLHLMNNAERAASKRRDYETATLWRDAIFKLEHKRDIYDAYHVIDILRAQMPDKEIERVLESYKTQYNHIRGGQPEQRSN